MSVQKFSNEDIKRLGAAVERHFAKHPQQMEKALLSAALRAQSFLLKEASKPQARRGHTNAGGDIAVDNGDFKKGWKVIPLENGFAVRNTVPHAPFVEHGRRPGKPPPYKPIRRWVERKLSTLGEGIGGTGGARVPKKMNQQKFAKRFDKQIDAATYLVRRKITRYGTVGYEFLSRNDWQLVKFGRDEILREFNI